MAGGFGFAAPIGFLPMQSAQQQDSPNAAAMQAVKTGGSLSGDMNALKSGYSRIKSGLNSMGIGNGPATQFISSPMLPSTPAIEDMSGAVGDAVGNVAAAGPGAFAGDAAAGLGDAAASGLGDAAAAGLGDAAASGGADALADLASLIFL